MVVDKLLKIVFGLLLIIIPIYVGIVFQGWGQAVKDFLQGGVLILVFLIGLVFLLLGLSELRE